jgi:hypothetical protein
MAAPEDAAPTFSQVSGVTGQVAIVPITDGGFQLLRILCGQSGAPGFTPTQDEVRKAEAGLVAYLQQSAPAKAAMLWQKADEYRRQYGGVIVGKGKAAQRKLIMNASCRDNNQEWLRRVIAVKDGGRCYYQLTFDLSSATFSNLQINGEG